MEKHYIDKKFAIKSKFEFTDNRTEESVDNWYVYTSNDVYKKVFGSELNKSSGYPWKRKVIKIYSKNKKCALYRIWRGCPRFVYSKDTLYLDKNAKYLLSNNGEQEEDVILTPSSKFCYYWNHFEPSIRCSFKLGFVSVVVSVISLIIGVISLIVAFR